MSKAIVPIKVCLVGASGRVGAELSKTLGESPDIEIVLAVDLHHKGCSLRELVGPEAPDLIIDHDLECALTREQVDVLVDFTHPAAAKKNALRAIAHQVAPIIGTSGITALDQEELREACEKEGVPVMVVPNFAIGAVLMMKFAEMAAKWMPDAEIIELHHDQKADAPSGTAYHTAELIAAARKNQPEAATELIHVEGVRGGVVNSVRVHSVRMKGLMAHQQVIFGSQGETLRISHDCLDRTTYTEGVRLAIREIRKHKGLIVGLDSLLFQGK